MAAPKPTMKFSLGVKKANVAQLTDRKRPRAVLDEEEVEDTRQELSITGFADGGVIHDAPVKQEKEVVIQGIPNRDWREESKRKRQKNGLPAERHGQVTEAEEKAKAAPVIKFGLTVTEKKDDEPEDVDNGVEESVPEPVEQPIAKSREITDDVALEALLHGKCSVDDDRVIAAPTEEEAFERDVHTAPDAPSLAAYEAMPVESFALAYLKGYGYKEGEGVGKDKPKKKAAKAERRPALLGIGAKEEAAVGIELGAWGKGSKGKRKVDEVYNPIVLVNKQTGEKLSEEEFQKKLEQQKLLKEDNKTSHSRRRSPSAKDSDYRSEKSSRKDKYDDDYEKEPRRIKDRERDKYREDKDSSSRDKDRRKDRDRDRDRENDRDDPKSRDHGRDRPRDYDSNHRSSRKDRRDRSPSSGDDRKRKRRDYDNDDRDSESSKRRQKDKDDRYYERGSSRREDRDRGRDQEKYRERDPERDREKYGSWRR